MEKFAATSACNVLSLSQKKVDCHLLLEIELLWRSLFTSFCRAAEYLADQVDNGSVCCYKEVQMLGQMLLKSFCDLLLLKGGHFWQ